MRKKAPPTDPLGRIIWDFRGLHHLSREAAAKALGVSVTSLTSYEKGFDVNTGKPSEPRESTLQMIARRMAEYSAAQGMPLGKTQDQLFREMLIATGKAPEMVDELIQGAQQLSKSAKSSPAYRQLEKQPKLKLLEGGIDGRYEPTEDELAILQQAEDEDVWFGILSQPGFWDDPPEERRSTFRYLEGLIDEARRFKRRQSSQ